MEDQLEERSIDDIIVSQPPPPPSHDRSINNEADESQGNQLFTDALFPPFIDGFSTGEFLLNVPAIKYGLE
jgi:hypothetical protein